MNERRWLNEMSKWKHSKEQVVTPSSTVMTRDNVSSFIDGINTTAETGRAHAPARSWNPERKSDEVFSRHGELE